MTSRPLRVFCLALTLAVLPALAALAQDPVDKVPAILRTEPQKEDPRDDALSKLLKARHNEAVAEMKVRFKEFQAGKATVDSMLGASQRLLESGIELSSSARERITLLERFLELAKEVERINQTLVETGKVSIADLHKARHLRLDTEIRLLRARQEAAKGKD